MRGLGYQVVAAETADAGLEHLQNGEQFDLLFTDIVVPGQINGIVLARELRQRDPAARILFTSGFASPVMLRDEIQTLDGAELISKPYRKAELAVLVRGILNQAIEVCLTCASSYWTTTRR